MIRHWKRHVLPAIEAIKPRRILEIGADWGWNTREILAYCRTSGCRADIVDPAPRPELHDELAKFSSELYHYHPLRSLQAIPQLLTPDIALIDGDHNWYTVFHELKQLYARAHETDAPPPICIMHDVGWPYARRDMYYNPDDIPVQWRHPYAYRGMLPGVSELHEDGMNGVLANALHEGGPLNGVMTAIEDYIASSKLDIQLYVLPYFNGLGFLVPEQRMTAELKALIEGFFGAEELLKSCIELEKGSMRTRATLQKTETRLQQRTDALERARRIMAKQKALIEAFEAKKAAAPE
jgi:hypothetical protein